MSQRYEENGQNNSGFSVGLLFGAIIGAAAAILIYRHDRSKVLDRFADKIESYFKDLFSNVSTVESLEPQRVKKGAKVVKLVAQKPPSTQKISVEIPKSVKTLELKPVPAPKLKKMFRK